MYKSEIPNIECDENEYDDSEFLSHHIKNVPNSSVDIDWEDFFSINQDEY